MVYGWPPKEWIDVKADYTNLDLLISWINTIHHKTGRINNDYDDFIEDNGKALTNVIIVGTNRIGKWYQKWLYVDFSSKLRPK